MKITANINSVKAFDWQVNTGEYKARECEVETSKEFNECEFVMMTFKSKENGTFFSLVKDGKCDIPYFEKPGTVSVGVAGYSEEEGEVKKRYSPVPTVQTISLGSYVEDGEESPTPTPSTMEELTTKIGEVEENTIKPLIDQRQVNVWDLASGIYIIKNKTVSTRLKLGTAKTYPCASGSIIIVSGAYSSSNLPVAQAGAFKKNVILVRCVGVTAFEVQSGVTSVNYTKNDDGTVTFTPEFVGGNVLLESNILNEVDFDVAENNIYNAQAINSVLASFAEITTNLDERLSAIEQNPPSSAIQTWFKAETDIQPSATIEEIEV